ncbi:MAG: gliding motility protein GldC [Candidatus Dadabacteria bacterium]|nr:gliding motility protein GldC [Candidatus Dadabacteria bacterium]
MSKDAEIKLKVMLGDDNVPEELFWEASQSEEPGEKRCEAAFISMWDGEKKESLVIDLWTKKMEVGEMNYHFYYTMMKMADTYERATSEKHISNRMREFAGEFAEMVLESFGDKKNS